MQINLVGTSLENLIKNSEQFTENKKVELSEDFLSTLFNDDKIDEIIELCMYCIKNKDINSIDSHILFYLGCAFRYKSRINEAYFCFSKIISNDKNNTKAHYQLGRLHGEMLSYNRREDINKHILGKSKVKKEGDDGLLFTCYDEQNITKNIFKKIPKELCGKVCVDIGASDGVTFSNSYFLFRDGWSGVAVEPDPELFFSLSHYTKEFVNVNCIKMFVNPTNIIDMLKTCNIPENFDFLSLDIDSYDYYVLEKIFEKYKPKVICTEINELFPPPIRFAMKFPMDENCKHFGQSISMLYDLLNKNDYSIIHLEYNNVFAIKKELLCYTDYKELTDFEAYENGLKNRKDWILKLPWNAHRLEKVWNTNPINLKELLNINDDYYHYEVKR